MDVEFREIDGVRTRILTVRGTGTPILLLHGFSDHAAGWLLFLRELERKGRTAVAVDLPGFGQAGPLQPGPLLPQFGSFVAEAVRVVAREHGVPLVVGNSLGGASAWVAGQEERLPLAGIVAVSPAGFGFTRPIRGVQAVLAARPGLLRPPPVPLPVLRWVLLRLYARGVGVGRRLDPTVGSAWVDQFSRREDVNRIASLVVRVLAETDEVGDLPLPAYPVLLIWGTRDRMVRTDRSFPGAESLRVSGWGHCPQLQDPEALAALVLSFEAGLPASTPRSA
jgi:pimeloyl-ACP methyl ester carboxylesterase